MNPRMHPVDDFSHGLFKICVSNVGSAGGTCTKDVLLAGVKVDSLLFEIWNKKVIDNPWIDTCTIYLYMQKLLN